MCLEDNIKANKGLKASFFFKMGGNMIALATMLVYRYYKPLYRLYTAYI